MRTRRLGPLHASWDRRSPAPEKNHGGPCFPVSVRPPPRPCFQQLVCISRPISSQLARDRVSRNRAISIHKSISNHLASFLHHQLTLSNRASRFSLLRSFPHFLLTTRIILCWLGGFTSLAYTSVCQSGFLLGYPLRRMVRWLSGCINIVLTLI